MKLFERPTHHRNTPERTPEVSDHLPQLPEGVTVPDDLSGLHPEMAEGPTRRARAVRWLRWAPAVLAVGVGAVAVALIVRGEDTTTTVVDWVPAPAVVEGPGSNSLSATPLTPTVIPWPNVTEGPGSNSLDATALTPVIVWPNVTEGPGSNSLDATALTPVIAWPNVTEGPGSNSLAP